MWLPLLLYAFSTFVLSGYTQSTSKPDPGVRLPCYGPSDAPKALCFQLESLNDDPNIVQISFLTKPEYAWGAIGFGSSMRDATIFTFYRGARTARDGSRNVILSPRESSQYGLPEYSIDADNAVVRKSVGQRRDGMYGAIFQLDLLALPRDRERFAAGENVPVMWAFGPRDEAFGAEDVDAGFEKHDTRHVGLLSINLSPNNADDADNTVQNKVQVLPVQPPTTIIIHGALMLVSWFFLVPAAIFIARYMKQIMPDWWFRTHLLMMMAAVLLTFISFGVVFSTAVDHFAAGAHAIVGLLVIVFIVFQTILGFVIDRLFIPFRDSIPWYDKLHWWSGRIIFLLATAAVVLGILQIGGKTEWWVAAITLFILGLIAHVIGQFILGQTHEGEEDFISPTSKNGGRKSGGIKSIGSTPEFIPVNEPKVPPRPPHPHPHQHPNSTQVPQGLKKQSSQSNRQDIGVSVYGRPVSQWVGKDQSSKPPVTHLRPTPAPPRPIRPSQYTETPTDEGPYHYGDI